jgi:hypothetical protein
MNYSYNSKGKLQVREARGLSCGTLKSALSASNGGRLRLLCE